MIARIMSRAHREALAIIRFLRSPRFDLVGGFRHAPTIEPLCQFSKTDRIRLGHGVRFLRGAVVLADGGGTISLGDGSIICRFAVVQAMDGRIEIGDRSVVGDFSNLYGHDGGLVIGRDVMIASGCRIIPSRHTFEEPDVPVSRQPGSSEGIAIGDGCWIGTNVAILDGVRIGDGAIIGAGAVVNRPIPAFAIAVGVPARVLRYRPGHGPA